MTGKWGTVVELWRYPVSSLGGERIEKTALDEKGVLHDRIWGLREAASGTVAEPESQKRWRFVPDIRARMGDPEPEICGKDGTWHAVSSRDAEAAASEKAGFPVAFVPLAATIADAGDDLAAPRYDRGHLHILTTASLRSLAALLPPDSRVDVRRFRPNLLVEMAEALDGFPDRTLIGRTVRIGAATVEITEPCERCSFTALAQGDLPFAKDVLHAIARHGGGGFGVLGRIVAPASIHVGDAVTFM